MNRLLFVPLAVASLLPPARAQAQDAKADAKAPPQNGIMAHDTTGTRSEANLILIQLEGGKFRKVHALACLTYGTAKWKSEYSAQVDEKTKGHMFRLGRDNWAIFDCSAPVDFGGVTVPAGLWYVAVARDDAGKWTLAILDPAKVKAADKWPNDADKAPRAYEIPLKHEKLDKVTAETLTCAWNRDPKSTEKGTFSITWGDQKVSASYEVKAPAPKAEAKETSGSKK